MPFRFSQLQLIVNSILKFVLVFSHLNLLRLSRRVMTSLIQQAYLAELDINDKQSVTSILAIAAC